MNSLILVLAASSVGVDYGWQPNQQGEIEYIIQIEPELLDAMRDGAEITSRVDPSVQDVRRFRIRVGRDNLPREGTTSAPAVPENRVQDKVAGEENTDPAKRSPLELKANIPGDGIGEPPAEEPTGAKLGAPPLISPDRLKTGGGGGFSLGPREDEPTQDSPAEKSQPGSGSYTPLKEPPAGPGEAGPTPIPDPESARLPTQADAGVRQVAEQPRKLEPSPVGEPLEGQQASYNKVVTEGKSANVASPSDISLPPEEAVTRPWMTLVLICLLLFASIGLNVYLGWIARGIYVRYRTLSLETLDKQAAAT